MGMDITAVVVAAITSVLGGGGLIMGLINAFRDRAKLKDGTINRRFSEIEKKLEHDHERFGQLEHQISELSKNIDDTQRIMKRGIEGIMLGLENDKVIFNTFRTNRINGESEKQDQKMDRYLSECARQSFNLEVKDGD